MKYIRARNSVQLPIRAITSINFDVRIHHINSIISFPVCPYTPGLWQLIGIETTNKNRVASWTITCAHYCQSQYFKIKLLHYQVNARTRNTWQQKVVIFISILQNNKFTFIKTFSHVLCFTIMFRLVKNNEWLNVFKNVHLLVNRISTKHSLMRGYRPHREGGTLKILNALKYLQNKCDKIKENSYQGS